MPRGRRVTWGAVWPWLLAVLGAAGLILFALDIALGAGWVYR